LGLYRVESSRHDAARIDIAMSHLLEQCRDRLAAHYGERLAGLVLYGSKARGDARPDSDFDLLVLLQGPFDWFDELRTIVDLLYPLHLESNRHISAHPVVTDEYERGTTQLYRNARAEGVAV
jgi:predicted nucleotidyltransferase